VGDSNKCPPVTPGGAVVRLVGLFGGLIVGELGDEDVVRLGESNDEDVVRSPGTAVISDLLLSISGRGVRRVGLFECIYSLEEPSRKDCFDPRSTAKTTIFKYITPPSGKTVYTFKVS
jgi:hypothetical protein